jgi:pyruvate, orthophosphate dikinase
LWSISPGACAELNGVAFAEGDWISLDGDTGEVFLGQREIVTERPETELAEVERWRADAAAHPSLGTVGHAAPVH